MRAEFLTQVVSLRNKVWDEQGHENMPGASAPSSTGQKRLLMPKVLQGCVEHCAEEVHQLNG